MTTDNIPTNELLFSVNTPAMQDRLNLPYYVMAHEVTHEWFGNQLMPAYTAGSRMLTESITEYISLKVYEKKFGRKMGLAFLNIQHDRYHNGRRSENEQEYPLMQVKTEQEYISYGKGAVVFNHLSYLIGEAELNEILRTFLLACKAVPGIYPTTNAFLQHLKDNVDGALHPLIDELFSEIIWHDFAIEEIQASSERKLDVIISHQVFGGKNEPVSYPITLAQMDENGVIIATKELVLTQSKTTIPWQLEAESTRLVLDPHKLYLDEEWGNNKTERLLSH